MLLHSILLIFLCARVRVHVCIYTCMNVQLQRVFCEHGGANAITEQNPSLVALCAQVDIIFRDG